MYFLNKKNKNFHLIIGRAKKVFCLSILIIGGACPGCPPESTPMPRHSIVVKCEVQHCSFVLQVLFGVKITFSILQTQNFTV